MTQYSGADLSICVRLTRPLEGERDVLVEIFVKIRLANRTEVRVEPAGSPSSLCTM